MAKRDNRANKGSLKTKMERRRLVVKYDFLTDNISKPPTLYWVTD
ncbi:hypothetical protein [Kingella oralis]|jgi:hypothetical protein|nr:hypothetical protein [Kingella oralis]